MRWLLANREPEPAPSEDGADDPPAPAPASPKWWIEQEPEEPEGLAEDYAGVEVYDSQARSLLWVGRQVERAAGDEGDGSTDFIASTGSVDRVGDVIDQASWRLGPYRNNPVVIHEHYGAVVGRGKAGIKTDDQGNKFLGLNVVWDDDLLNPQGQLDAHQHRAGFRHAVSVRFLPGKFQNRTELPSDHPYYIDPQDMPRWRAGYLYSFCELLEVSSVAVPCNREALQLSMLARQLELAGETDPGPLEAAKSLLRRAKSFDQGELEEFIRSVVAKHLEAAVPEQLRGLLRNDQVARSVIAAVTLGQPTGEPRNPTPPAKSQGPSWTRS